MEKKLNDIQLKSKFSLFVYNINELEFINRPIKNNIDYDCINDYDCFKL